MLHNCDAALVALGRQLKSRGYRFTTVTPATHRRVNARPENQIAACLEDIFGWSRPFSPDMLPDDMMSMLREGEALALHGNLCRSAVRFSSLESLLFVHSAFPTEAADAVFFGPDTYRFANALRTAFQGAGNGAAMTVVDIGCGSGAGGIYLRSLLPARTQVDLILGDVNSAATRFAAVNAIVNDCARVRVVNSDVMSEIDGRADIIIANPPYLVDADERVYRHGGGKLGIDLSLRIVEESLPRLAAEGLPAFDFVFIDADKQSIPEYFEWALKLTRVGSVIVVDNVVRKGAVLDRASTDPNVQGVRRFNELLAKTARVSATTVQTVGSKGYDGFALIRVTSAS